MIAHALHRALYGAQCSGRSRSMKIQYGALQRLCIVHDYITRIQFPSSSQCTCRDICVQLGVNVANCLQSCALRSASSFCLPYDAQFMTADLLLLLHFTALTCTLGFNRSFWIVSTTICAASVPKAVFKRLWSTTGFFGKFFQNNQNGPIARTSCLPRARSICPVGFVVCILFIVIRSHFLLYDDYGWFSSAVIKMRFATRIFACLFCSYMSFTWQWFGPVRVSTSCH